jgi:hypothetical protein
MAHRARTKRLLFERMVRIAMPAPYGSAARAPRLPLAADAAPA